MKYVFKKKLYLLGAFVIDVVGNVMFSPAKIFRRGLPRSFSRILVVRGDHIGDVVSATVVLEPLRRAFPEARIDFLAPSWAADILTNNPFFDDIVRFDPPWFDRRGGGLIAQLKGVIRMSGLMKRGGYDLVIDLRGDVRHILAAFLAGVKGRIGYGITGGGFLLTERVPYDGIMHETERNMALLRPLGIEEPPREIKLYFPESEKRKGALFGEKTGKTGPYAVLHVVPGHPAKNWSDDGFAHVARYLRDHKKLVPVAVGSASDNFRIRRISDKAGRGIVNLAGKTSLGELACLLKEADLFVGIDSGPSHLAAAAGTPSVILFSGVNDPGQWAPGGRNTRIVYPGKGKDLSSIGPEEACRVIDEVLGA